jgi:hypothetical protein
MPDTEEGEMPPEPIAGNQPPADGAPTGDNQQQSQTPPTWDAILATLPDDQKALYEQHTSGLRTALQSERQGRSELAKQINTLSKQAAEGSDAKKQLEAAAAQLEAANQRADFMAEATKPEIGCSNPSLAFIAAREAGAIDQKGRVNWDALKTQSCSRGKSRRQAPDRARRTHRRRRR